MKLEHTKEFNVQHAKAGAPYAQRNGLAARIGIWNSNHPNGTMLVGTQTIQGYEHSCSWEANGNNPNGTKSNDLVMLPLGYCEDKPVFVGDELEQINGDLGWAVGAAFNNFTNLRWKRTTPVIPTLGSVEKTDIEYMLSTYRAEIEAYWKALDEFKGVGK
jgi:hypothetical protein